MNVEKALWHQWKLYSLWQTVMKDYSTVFSRRGSEEDDECALPGLSNCLVYRGGPSILHYRVVASSRPEVSKQHLDHA